MTEIRESGWQAPAKESFGSRVVSGVSNGILGWWEKAGPKGVENHWVEAHQRIVDSMPDEDSRKEAFRLSADAWRKTGDRIGAVATGIDFSLAGVGAWLGIKNPFHIFWDTRFFAGNVTSAIDSLVKRGTGKNPHVEDKLRDWIQDVFVNNPIPWNRNGNNNANIAIDQRNRRRVDIAGRLISIIPLGGAVASYVGMGPAHIAGALAARAAEGITKQGFKAKKK